MTDKPVEVVIKSFHPLSVVLPDEPLVGTVRVVLPPIHVHVYDLSMGGIVPGDPHLGADAPLYGFNITGFTEPVDKGKFTAFLVEVQDYLEGAWKAIQQEYDKKGALLG